MKHIYLISGLGADQRVFEHLHFSTDSITHIQWITPGDHETIEQYARRLLPQIVHENPILIGLSFGGMIAVEIGKQIKTEKIILISSAPTQGDIPLYYRVFGKMGVHKLLPVAILKSANALTYWFFGTESEKEKALLKLILEETDPVFLKWAINAIVHWENITIPNQVYRIHGTRDRILPMKQVDHAILDGGHFMVLNKHKKINQVINTLLDEA